ncbi:Peptidoglycan D,D-transpeptidase MrdA [Candidatus Entotheonellaceae bacterium PAL068K]
MIGTQNRPYIQRSAFTPDDAFRRRLRLLFTIMAIGLCLLVVRTWHLQVIWGNYYLHQSENNRLQSLRTKSLRGKILDRHGRVLADNRAAYTLMAIPEDLPPTDQLDTLLQKLDIDVDLVTWRQSQATAAFKPVPVQRDLPRNRVAYFAEHRMDFPGLFLDVEYLRSYPHGTLAAHLIGYLGEINESQLQHTADQSYQPGDLRGQYGLEHTYESMLRGQPGVRQVEVDAFGREIRMIASRPPQSGANLILTIDLHLQQLAEELLVAHTGSIVALDPRNGQLLALANNPAFDPNRFATRLTAAEWTALIKNPKQPLNNRAVQGQYPPGSIFKIVTALGALEDGVINPLTSTFCPGHYVFGRRTYRDWKPSGHGVVTLREALSQSCDVFFYRVGQELGIDRLARYARAFGLGRISGFAPRIEKPGLIPSAPWKRQTLGQPWYAGETLIVAIGQGYTLLTPLQAVNMVATLANGGTVYQPYVVLLHQRADGTLVQENTSTVLRKLQLDPQHIAAVKQGLWSVVNDPDGTGKRARHEHIVIAGKTGTAQVIRLPEHHTGRQWQEQLLEYHRDHAWFVAFAPFEAPRIAVVIMIEHAGKAGSRFAGYAKALIHAYLQRYPVAADLRHPLQPVP